MYTIAEVTAELESIPRLRLELDVPLARYSRFGIGGPASVLADAPDERSFIAAIHTVRAAGIPLQVIGGGSNLICSDAGFPGAILRYTGRRISAGENRISFEAGAVLQHLVDFSIDEGLAGLHTMTGIPGWCGGAVYGNAGAYGHSIHESICQVRFYDGTEIRTFDNAQCEFRYRESIFKRRKDWILFSADVELQSADTLALRKEADEILGVRNAKYPPTMKCAGSIFKNLLFAELPSAVQQVIPDKVVREGKVPSAWFLEQVGAKGMRDGDIQVAEYHANLIYNDGQGTSAQLLRVIHDLKVRVQDRFGFSLEEEVQYVGFEAVPNRVAEK